MQSYNRDTVLGDWLQLAQKKTKKEEKDIGREGYYPGMQKKANIIKEMTFPAYSTPGEAAAWQVPREGG